MKKYGKQMADIIDFKEYFIKNNSELLSERLMAAKKYNMQPQRCKCKLCNADIRKNQNYFESHDIKYILCDTCGHLNGIHEDTKEFNNYIYLEKDYGKAYRNLEEDYWRRVEKVYKPKFDFLVESIGEDQVLSGILDIGAGSGFFVAAGRAAGYKNITGVEISDSQVEFGNKMLGEKLLSVIDPDNLYDLISRTRSSIISAIGVLEHLSDLRGVIDSINENKRIKYIYCSVPMFSISVFLEVMNEECFNRQLGGGHTHLFTNSSIDYFCKHYGWRIRDSWRFGSDLMDFYRMMLVKIEKFPVLKSCVKDVDKSIIDKIQRILDEEEISSEKHFVFERVGRSNY